MPSDWAGGRAGGVSLALAQGDALQLGAHAAGLGEGQHVRHRVAARAQHEDQRGHLRGVLRARPAGGPLARLERPKRDPKKGEGVGGEEMAFFFDSPWNQKKEDETATRVAKSKNTGENRGPTWK